MKIKNISNNDLVLSIAIGMNGNLMMNIRPNQVMYCENSSNLNKQLVIYEKKKLISIVKDAEKPEYVGYYKPYFESGTYQSAPKKTNTSVLVEVDDDDDDDAMINIVPEEISISNMQEDLDEGPEEAKQPSEKKGRGRPKKAVDPNIVSKEKKGRGRPKGSTKKTK